ncbi:MAG: IS982 family transposase [Xenococcus sp. (in: cyanobacteria)]
MEVTNLSIKKSFLMNSIDFESLLIIIFVLVDDWYEDKGKTLKGKLPGVKPEMSDSEIMTLAIMMDYLPFPGETQFLGFIRANYGQWFPNLLDRSQFNRRLRKLGQMLEILRREWVKQLGGLDAVSLIIDTKPIPVLGYRRSKRCSDFEGSADYGYCAARKMKYFGYKLVMLSTLGGLPIAYDLVAASTDERLAVEGVLQVAHGCDIYGDKGFIGQDWQAQITDSTGNHIWTIQRSNQEQQVSSSFKRLIGRVRQRIEGVFHEIQNTGRNPERLLNKTVQGFLTHMAAKITSHTLRLLLRHQFGIDVLTFQSISI